MKYNDSTLATFAASVFAELDFECCNEDMEPCEWALDVIRETLDSVPEYEMEYMSLLERYSDEIGKIIAETGNVYDLHISSCRSDGMKNFFIQMIVDFVWLHFDELKSGWKGPHWVYVNYYPKPIPHCSECGASGVEGWIRCPICGAKMSSLTTFTRDYSLDMEGGFFKWRKNLGKTEKPYSSKE